MSITVEAIYENGVLKLVEPLPLKEHEKVQVTIALPRTWAEHTAGMMQWAGSPEALDYFAMDKDLEYDSDDDFPSGNLSADEP